VTPYFERDGVAVFNADCLQVIEAQDDRSLDLVITDPPYSSGARTDSERQVRGAMLRSMEDEDWFSHDQMTTWGFQWFLRSVFVALRPKLTEGAHVYLFCDWRMAPTVYGLMESCGYRVNHCLVWAKDHYGMGTYWRNQHEHIVFASLGMPADMLNRGMGSVLHGPAVSPQARVHPTEKPLWLVQKIMAAAPGHRVIDPFCGSGPVLRAAGNLGRRAIGCDVNPHHCAVAAQRLEQTVLALPEPKPERVALPLEVA
jgi:site-specific DNA-methyltransferase (adenine-specific)